MKSGHPDQLGSCEEAQSKGVAEKTKRWRLYILPQFLSNLNGRLHIKSYLGGRGGEGEGEIRPFNSNIAYPRFEVYKTFLCVFMSNFMVFMR